MSTHSTNPLPRIPDSEAARQGDEARRYWPDAWSPHSSLRAYGRDCALPVAHLMETSGRPVCGGVQQPHDPMSAVQLCMDCARLGPPRG